MRDSGRKGVFVAILAGGRGERLWPKSRMRLPKQNLRFFGKRTILQDTLRRAARIASGNIYVITSRQSLPHTSRQIRKGQVKEIIAEPVGRNTAPAIGLAALLAWRRNRDAIMVAMPSDHIIRGQEKFYTAVDTAISTARKEDVVVTIGIRPTRAESAYGYIELEKRPSRLRANKAYKAVRFIEKPSVKKAAKMIEENRYFWNSGIFIFKTSHLLLLLRRHMPVLYRGLVSLPEIERRRAFARSLRNLYRDIGEKSLDYAVMEKTEGIRVVPAGFEWNDLGSFNSIANLAKIDEHGNAVFVDHIGIDTKRSVVLADTKCLVGTIGVKDLVVVVCPDAVLVCDRNRVGEIRDLVDRMKKSRKYLKFL